MPTCSNIELIAAPIEMSNEGFDYQNIAEAVMTYIITCLPSGVPSILFDMLDEYNNSKKYRVDGNDAYIDYLNGMVKEKLV
jgi:hypothetical protein